MKATARSVLLIIWHLLADPQTRYNDRGGSAGTAARPAGVGYFPVSGNDHGGPARWRQTE
jgi:hypothetical protein